MGKVDGLSADKGNAEAKPGSVIEEGCYLLQYSPAQSAPDVSSYEGTLRVARVQAQADAKLELRAAGDLYARPADPRYGGDPNRWPIAAEILDPPPDEDVAQAIPVFPRAAYRFHLQVTQIEEGESDSVTLRFDVHSFEREGAWPNLGSRVAVMTRDWTQAVPTFGGSVREEDTGLPVGVVTARRVSRYLRKATVVVDRVDGLGVPDNTGQDAGFREESWVAAFREAGWHLTVKARTVTLDGKDHAVRDGVWPIGALHQALLQAKAVDLGEGEFSLNLGSLPAPRADAKNGDGPPPLDLLDREWRYHLLCVPLIEGFDRGVMFDTYGTDSDNTPREGAAVAAAWRFPRPAAADPADSPVRIWGKPGAANQALQEVAKAYFRVAVHEIGHAMGLDHNHQDRGFMNTTDVIAEDSAMLKKKAVDAARAYFATLAQVKLLESLGEGKGLEQLDEATQAAKDALDHLKQASDAALKAATPFPQNIQERFHPRDLERLRFGPDVTLRPGTAYDEGGPLFGDTAAEEAQGLTLEVKPLLPVVPLGAPVRVRLTIKNTSSDERSVPGNLSLSSGFVSGEVFDPAGTRRTFWPVKRAVDGEPHHPRKPGESVTSACTLLRGAQKALFPRVGTHRIRLRVQWERGGSREYLAGETEVRVSAPVDGAHQTAAVKILSNPDTLLSLAIGGEQFVEGNQAIDAALRDPVLRPHFAVIDIKRLIRQAMAEADARVQDKKLDQVRCYLDDQVVLSADELARIASLLDAKALAGASVKVLDETRAALARVRKRIEALG